MTTIPQHWASYSLGDLVDILDYARVPVSAKEREARLGSIPYYGAAGRVGWIDKSLFDEDLILLGEDGVQFFDPARPKAYMVSGPSWVNNHAHVLRAREAIIDRRYLSHYLNQFNYHGYANGTTRLKLTQAAMRRIPVTAPDLPMQRRIAQIVEDHLSRLDNAVEGARRSDDRINVFIGAAIWRLTHDLPSAETRLLSDVAEVRLGRQRSPSNHSGDRMRPYLRAANVTWNKLVLSDVKEMNFTENESAIYRLQDNDILLTEASGSPAEVGKSAIYRGEVGDVCFQNTLLRVRCREGHAPFIHYFLLAEAMRGRFVAESKGVGIRHLGQARLARWHVELPTLERQIEAASRVTEMLELARRLQASVANVLHREPALRTSILRAAFSGRLTGEGSDMHIIEEMAVV